MTALPSVRKISSDKFYSEFHGHLVEHLQVVLACLRSSDFDKDRSGLIFLAGDSSLDNKYWFNDSAPPPRNGYHDAIRGNCIKDVCFHLNNELTADKELQERIAVKGCINTSIEATTLSQRGKSFCCSTLFPQDEFIRDNITSNDVLVVSVGGNDIALAPSLGTIFNLVLLVFLAPTCFLRCATGVVLPLGSIGSFFLGFPIGFGYFVRKFRTEMARYISSLCSNTKPRLVCVCAIYFLDVKGRGSWADRMLSLMGYNRNPERLQILIRRIFVTAISKINIPGVKILPLPLYEALDGSDSKDYVARVEPSDRGGRKLAEFILNSIDKKIAKTP